MQVLFLNLKDGKNNLRRRVISGEIAPERLAAMESSEMASNERKKEDRAIKAANEKAAMMPKSEKSISDQLTCGKCGQKRVSYTQAQTRSADEPMTTVSIPRGIHRCIVLTECSSVNVNCVVTDGSSHRSRHSRKKKNCIYPMEKEKKGSLWDYYRHSLPLLLTIYLASNFKRGCISATVHCTVGGCTPVLCIVGLCSFLSLPCIWIACGGVFLFIFLIGGKDWLAWREKGCFWRRVMYPGRIRYYFTCCYFLVSLPLDIATI